jgi:hypothetical protein
MGGEEYRNVVAADTLGQPGLTRSLSDGSLYNRLLQLKSRRRTKAGIEQHGDEMGNACDNDSAFVGSPVLDPVTLLPCRALANVTILVSNYYSIPHPVPAVFAQLDAAVRGFDQALRYWLQFTHMPQGSRVAVVDLYSASLERRGLVTIERRLGLQGPFDFDIHPTNLGHSFIAQEFESVWKNLP